MSNEINRPDSSSTPIALNPPDGRANISMLDYLTGCHPPLDLVTIQSVLQEVQVAPDLQDEVAKEIRLAWSTARLSDDHRTPEQVLEYAKDLAWQAASALDVPGRIPRAALIAAYKKTRRSGTGGA